MKRLTIYTYAIRLKPGEDLKESIEKVVKEKSIKAGWIATCVGSTPLEELQIKDLSARQAEK